MDPLQVRITVTLRVERNDEGSPGRQGRQLVFKHYEFINNYTVGFSEFNAMRDAQLSCDC